MFGHIIENVYICRNNCEIIMQKKVCPNIIRFVLAEKTITNFLMVSLRM